MVQWPHPNVVVRRHFECDCLSATNVLHGGTGVDCIEQPMDHSHPQCHCRLCFQLGPAPRGASITQRSTERTSSCLSLCLTLFARENDADSIRMDDGGHRRGGGFQ